MKQFTLWQAQCQLTLVLISILVCFSVELQFGVQIQNTRQAKESE